MAVPANPTVDSIVTQALKRATLRTPTAAMITEATDHALQEVKADLMLKAPTHKLLLTTATTITTRGQQRYATPDDHNIQQSITLLDGPDTYRGTAQGGGASNITLAASFSATDDEIAGKYIIVTTGAGAQEYREILSYNDGTKIATVDLGWNSVPTALSTYLICSIYNELPLKDTTSELDTTNEPTVIGTPIQASISGQEFLLYPVPDKSTYGLIIRYWVDLSTVNETSTLFVQLLREWRSIWIQGIAVKSMQRNDEDRYQSELSVYNFMLDSLVPQTCRVTTVRQQD